MAAGDSFQIATGQPRSVGQAWKYFWRAMLLKCPVCGTRPIFIPWYRVRSFHDWFTPLDGCPRCGYPYEREPGYFLLAVFGFNPGFAVFVATALFVYLAVTEQAVRLPAWEFMCIVGLPVPIINILIARHAKALFLALDHFVDPHVRDADDGGDDDDDDGIGLLPDPPAGNGSGTSPEPDGDGPEGHPWPEDEHAGRPTVLVGRH
ncbi:MAG: DUF983 domain-containing protein [Gluconacetobacter diazotrophicus]|nr:DUF983 domain-containing protein [Gluconacetobacter diazotrophicus]